MLCIQGYVLSFRLFMGGEHGVTLLSRPFVIVELLAFKDASKCSFQIFRWHFHRLSLYRTHSKHTLYHMHLQASPNQTLTSTPLQESLPSHPLTMLSLASAAPGLATFFLFHCHSIHDVS